jgi:hypothetical protein
MPAQLPLHLLLLQQQCQLHLLHLLLLKVLAPVAI